MLVREEWKVRVPWGCLSMIRWGDRQGPPVLMLHGRQDSAAVFLPLLRQMPPEYNYVALDMPGNGLSDPFPRAVTKRRGEHYAVLLDSPPRPGQPFINCCSKSYLYHNKRGPFTSMGPKLTRLHFLAAMEMAIAHLGWKKFIFIGHSMGCEQGLFFNVVYPGMISKMILIDAGPTLMRMQIDDPAEYQKAFIDSYYENYFKENYARKKHTKKSAIAALMRMRDIIEALAEPLIERNFHPIEDDGKGQEKNTDPGITSSGNTVVPTLGKTRSASENVASAPGNGKGQENEGTSAGPHVPPYVNHPLTQQVALLPIGPPPKHKPDPLSPAQEMEKRIKKLRSLDAVGYLSWDNRLKNVAPTNYGNDYYFELFKTVPPTLVIRASTGAKRVEPRLRPKAEKLVQRMVAEVCNFKIVDVEGGHDVHYTNPERVIEYIKEFLQNKPPKKTPEKLMSKL